MNEYYAEWFWMVLLMAEADVYVGETVAPSSERSQYRYWQIQSVCLPHVSDRPGRLSKSRTGSSD